MTSIIPRQPTQEQLAQMHHDYLRAIQPVIKLKADMLACLVPTFTITKDGEMRSHFDLTDEQKKALDECDELIASIGRQIFKDAARATPP